MLTQYWVMSRFLCEEIAGLMDTPIADIQEFHGKWGHSFFKKERHRGGRLVGGVRNCFIRFADIHLRKDPCAGTPIGATQTNRLRIH